MHPARYTSPASHRRPPAFIGPRRAMDSCGVGAFSLNYGPQTTRGKSPYVSVPRLSRAVPTTREPHTVQLTTHLSDFRAAKFPHAEFRLHARVSLRRSCIRSCLTTHPYLRHQQRVPLRPATSSAIRVTNHLRVCATANRSRCPARPANTPRRHTIFSPREFPPVARFCLATMSRYYNTESRRFCSIASRDVR